MSKILKRLLQQLSSKECNKIGVKYLNKNKLQVQKDTQVAKKYIQKNPTSPDREIQIKKCCTTSCLVKGNIRNQNNLSQEMERK